MSRAQTRIVAASIVALAVIATFLGYSGYVESREQACCTPPHPLVLPQGFNSIRAANDRGDEVVGTKRDDDLEWEVIDDRGMVVC